MEDNQKKYPVMQYVYDLEEKVRGKDEEIEQLRKERNDWQMKCLGAIVMTQWPTFVGAIVGAVGGAVLEYLILR